MKTLLYRKASLVILRDGYGRIWLTRRKKRKRDSRNRTGIKGLVVYKPLYQMNKHKILYLDFSRFSFKDARLDNSIWEGIVQSKRGATKIMGSILHPLENMIDLVEDREKEFLKECYEKLSWIWKK